MLNDVFSPILGLSSQPPIYEPAVEVGASCGVWGLNARLSFEFELLPHARPLGYHWRRGPINFSLWAFCAAGRDVLSSDQTDCC